MKLLITGATGFIGRALIPHLVANSRHRVTILIREAYSQPELHPLPPPLNVIRNNIDVVYADLRNFAQTARAVKVAKPEGVIHLAAAGVRDPFLPVNLAIRHNLQGTLHLLRACFANEYKVRQCIIGRTPGERVTMNVYAASKAAAWDFCQMYGRTHHWPIHGAMIFQAYGPGQSAQNFIPAALSAAGSGRDFPMSSGKQVRDWIYIDDVVTGLSAMLGSTLPPATTVELGSGAVHTLQEVAALIYRLVARGGRPLPGVLPDRPGEVPRQVADTENTHAQINWQARISLETGLRKIASFVQSNQEK